MGYLRMGYLRMGYLRAGYPCLTYHRHIVWHQTNERSIRMRVAVIRHHDVDSAGFIGAAFEARGARLDTYLFPDDGPLPALGGVDHIVVLGAISSVNDADPWIAAEQEWLGQAGTLGVPVLGICFGGQQLCVISGGRVEQSPCKEIGWSVVESADVDLVPAGPWLEFHGDRCLLPEGVRVLARNDLCVQAFTVGRHLGVQFHPEVDGPQLKRWLDGGGRAEALREGVDPDDLLAATIREEPAARARADRLVAAALKLAHP
jgi:GMP synthase-like glutamine amidotransferase